MTKKEAVQQLQDHEELSQALFGVPTDWRIEKRDGTYVLVCSIAN